MLQEEGKQVLERIVTENPERGKLQRELQKLYDQILDETIDREDTANEGSA